MVVCIVKVNLLFLKYQITTGSLDLRNVTGKYLYISLFTESNQERIVEEGGLKFLLMLLRSCEMKPFVELQLMQLQTLQ